MEKEIIQKQVELIKESVKIGRLFQSDIDRLGGIVLSNSKEYLIRVTNLNIYKFHIEIFFDYVDFLSGRLAKDKSDDSQYYVPLLRTLLDIYIELLYLVNQPFEWQAFYCVGNHLFILAKNIKSYPSGGEKERQRLIELYYSECQFSMELIKGSSIPLDPYKFSKKKLDELGILLPAREEILKPSKKYFEGCSETTRKLFSTITPDNFYEEYRWLSDYVHGNIYSLMKKSSKKVNERNWIISKLNVYSTLMIELVNKKITGESRKKECENWISNCQKERGNFAYYWFNKKMGIMS